AGISSADAEHRRLRLQVVILRQNGWGEPDVQQQPANLLYKTGIGRIDLGRAGELSRPAAGTDGQAGLRRLAGYALWQAGQRHAGAGDQPRRLYRARASRAAGPGPGLDP